MEESKGEEIEGAAGLLTVREVLAVGICPVAPADGLVPPDFPITPNVKCQQGSGGSVLSVSWFS